MDAPNGQPAEASSSLTRWVVGSIIVHVAAVAVLMLTPLRSWVFSGTAQKAEISIDGPGLARIVDQMRSLEAVKLRRMLRDLDQLRVRIVAIRDSQVAQLQTAGGKPIALSASVGEAVAEDAGIRAIYDTARRSEAAVARYYQELRAAMLARRDGIGMDEAMANARVPVPVRAELDPILEAVITTSRDGTLVRFKETLRQADTEVQNMIDATTNLVKMAQQLEDAEKFGITMDINPRTQDAGGLDSGPVLLPTELVPSEITPGQGDFNPLPGRRLAGEGDPTTWFFIDSWWVLGPFDNSGRRLLNARFLPEATVDLDAVANGKRLKNGTVPQIRWEWTTSSTLKIQPRVTERYAIYYAWTEVWSDRDRDVWIATGSDDFGKLWINDELVWVSPETAKPFNAAENTQVVHLRQGHNKILFRCENAGGTMGWSLLMCAK
jgi:hypothetical protein